MKPAPFHYQAARSLDEAIELVGGSMDDDVDVRVIAGGQSLGPMLNLRMVRPTLLIDIHRIDALRTISRSAEGALRIGACVTHAALEDAPAASIPEQRLGAFLRFVAGGIAYRAIRTRGTIGGSLAHADPAADWPCALAALGASIELAGPGGTRVVPARSFGRGLFETAIEPGEVVAAVVLPTAPVLRWGYRKHCRKIGEFPHALAACVDRGDDLFEVWLGATGGAPVAVALDRAVVVQSAGTAPAQRRSALREHVATLLPDWIAQGDAYARHLHAQVATEAVIDALTMEP